MSIVLNKNNDIFLMTIQNKLSQYKNKLTMQDAADILGCAKESIRKRIISQEIRSVRIGRSDYIAKDWLIDYVQNGGGLRKNLHDEKCMKIVSFCHIPRTREEIRVYIGYSTKSYTNLILRKLITDRLIKQTEPSHSNYQKYISTTVQNKFIEH